MKLEKLRKASFQELRVRAAQKVSALGERRGWSSLAKLPADAEFGSLLNSAKARSTQDLLDHFRLRSEPSFFRSFQRPEETAAAFKSRRPEQARRIVEKAERICAGKFDLLGFTGLDFGNPIDWHFEPISRKRVPLVHWSKLDYLDAGVAGDKKITWELNRQQYFATLGQAYLLTNDEEYARAFAEHLESWMEANPPKLGINWASSLEVAFRSMAWLWGFYFFKSSPSLSPEIFRRAWKFLYLNARHLESYLSTYFSPNTHLTGEALGLFFLGTLLPEFKEAKRWQELGSQILIEQLPVHVRRDGVYFEQSSYYHRYTTDFYLHFLLLARVNNFALPSVVDDSTKRLLDHLMYITRPDGTTPLFGDDDGGRLAMLDVRAADDFRGTLAVGAVVFNRGDYKLIASEAVEQLLWLTGVEGLGAFDSIAEKEPAETSKAFFDSGYFMMRDGWTRESNYLLFDCGPHGSLNCGHAHADALSIDVAASGRAELIDSGTYIYTGSEELRYWFRSSQAHNTVTLDNESSSEPGGTFSWKSIANCSLEHWISNDRYDFVSGRHDGYMRLNDPATLAREILFIKGDYWVMRDVVTSRGEHRAEVRFHLDPRSQLDIQCFGDGEWVEEEAWVSHCYGEKEPAKTRSFSARLQGNGEVVSFLLPQSRTINEVAAPEGRAFIVSVGKTRDLVIIRAAEWFWFRFSNGEVLEAITPRIKADDTDKSIDLADLRLSELIDSFKDYVRD